MTQLILTSAQRERITAVLPLLAGTSAIVAGGYIRDSLTGAQPADIDIFASPADAPRVRANVEASQSGAWAAVAEFLDGAASGGAAGLRDVAQLGRVQLIVVDDPIARVHVFDAHCNMLWVGADGAVQAASPYAYNHAMAQVWEPQPATVMTPAEAEGRRARFEAKGYSIGVLGVEMATCGDDIDAMLAVLA